MFWLTVLPMLMFLLLALVGTLLMRKGSRPLNDHPHCKKCKFDLSSHGFAIDRTLRRVLAQPGSAESERAICTECGSRLTPMYSVQLGVKHVRWRLYGPGLALFALPYLLFFSTMFRPGGQASLIARYSPESLVIRLGERDADRRYVDELIRRIQNAELSPSGLSALASRTVARASQPARMSKEHSKLTEQLLGALFDAGAIAPADIARILGEPRVTVHVADRSYRNWAPMAFVYVLFATPNLPNGMSVTIENVSAYATDVLDRHGVMTESQIAPGSTRGGTLWIHSQSSSCSFNVSLLSYLADARNFKSEAPSRDIHLAGDLVVSRAGVEIARYKCLSIDATQQLIDAGEALIALDMDPAANASSRASFDGIWASYGPANGQPMACLVIRWPMSNIGVAQAYRMTVRPAGRPDAPALLVAAVPPDRSESIAGKGYYVVTSHEAVDATARAFDITLEPDLAFANKRLVGVLTTRIAGESFTIRDVLVRDESQPLSQP